MSTCSLWEIQIRGRERGTLSLHLNDVCPSTHYDTVKMTPLFRTSSSLSGRFVQKRRGLGILLIQQTPRLEHNPQSELDGGCIGRRSAMPSYLIRFPRGRHAMKTKGPPDVRPDGHIPCTVQDLSIPRTETDKTGHRPRMRHTTCEPRAMAPEKAYGRRPMPPSSVRVSPFMYLKSGPQSWTTTRPISVSTSP